MLNFYLTLDSHVSFHDIHTPFILIWSHTYDVIYISSESEGTFEFGNYWKEVEDLHSVLLYFSEKDYETSAIVGHSKGRCSLHM